MAEAAPDDHSITISGSTVANRTIDVEPLLSPSQEFRCNWKRKNVRVGRDIQFVLVAFADGHSTRRQSARRTAISEKVAGCERRLLRLICHVLRTTGQQERSEQEQETLPAVRGKLPFVTNWVNVAHRQSKPVRAMPGVPAYARSRRADRQLQRTRRIGLARPRQNAARGTPGGTASADR